jgi:hypothetical protein
MLQCWNAPKGTSRSFAGLRGRPEVPAIPEALGAVRVEDPSDAPDAFLEELDDGGPLPPAGTDADNDFVADFEVLRHVPMLCYSDGYVYVDR